MTWGVRILTLHLKYVAGYTGHLLFLFERTQQLLRWQPGACALSAPSSGQVQATPGRVFARQAAAADVEGNGSRWQQAGNKSKDARLLPDTTQCKIGERCEVDVFL